MKNPRRSSTRQPLIVIVLRALGLLCIFYGLFRAYIGLQVSISAIWIRPRSRLRAELQLQISQQCHPPVPGRFASDASDLVRSAAQDLSAPASFEPRYRSLTLLHLGGSGAKGSLGFAWQR